MTMTSEQFRDQCWLQCSARIEAGQKQDPALFAIAAAMFDLAAALKTLNRPVKPSSPIDPRGH